MNRRNVEKVRAGNESRSSNWLSQAPRGACFSPVLPTRVTPALEGELYCLSSRRILGDIYVKNVLQKLDKLNFILHVQ